MGQREKAREIARSHGFFTETECNTQEVQSVLEVAAAAAATGGLKGTIVQSQRTLNESELISDWVMKGPGGFMTVLDFRVRALPSTSKQGLLEVTMEIGNYRYQKGSLGMKPTMNGSPVIKKFNSIVLENLSNHTIGGTK